MSRVLRDVRAGRPRVEALRELAERLEFAPVSSALVQGELMGSSLGPILRTQSDQRRTERFHVQPKNRSGLKVFRNYQAALQQAGFTSLYACELRACLDAAIRNENFTGEVIGSRKWIDTKTSSPSTSVYGDVRFLTAKSTRNGSDAYVMVFVAEEESMSWKAPVAVVLVAEPKPVEGGKVQVNADALQRGLADGKIALYGLYFDTGKAEVKPESKPQLTEMARLLQANKTLKVLIVGHTDNQGASDANLALSQRRADAVVAALVKEHKVDGSRLRARGVANFAPMTTNASEAGRAKNRRVELVAE